MVADVSQITPWLRKQYPSIQITTAPTFLSGIDELANGPVHAILAGVDPAFVALPMAIRGLRVAAGPDVPLVLCCEPHTEPVARKALSSGATDYVLCPLRAADLDPLLALHSAARSTTPLPPTSGPELEALAAALQVMAGQPQGLLKRLAELLGTALPTAAVAVTFDGVTERVGSPRADIVLREPVMVGGQELGAIELGPPSGSGYSRANVDKLRHYALIFGHILLSAQRQHHWQQLAMTDDLTGLPNRRYVRQFLETILQQAAAERFQVTVCMFDIDNFKQYNDEFGHSAGDEIIRSTGQLFLRRCRTRDVVARYGGDEFVVVFWESENPRKAGSRHPEEAIEVMQRFQESLREHEFAALGPEGRGALTISGGLASFPWNATTATELLKLAGQALQEAKAQGKNCMHLVGSHVAS